MIVGQCALLAAAVAVASSGSGVAQLLAAVALGELALRRPGRRTWWGAAAVAAASGWNYFPLYSPRRTS